MPVFVVSTDGKRYEPTPEEMDEIRLLAIANGGSIARAAQIYFRDKDKKQEPTQERKDVHPQ